MISHIPLKWAKNHVVAQAMAALLLCQIVGWMIQMRWLQ
jgi:hypothetical protein